MKRHHLLIQAIVCFALVAPCLADKTVSKYRIQKLITDLNNSAGTNKTAQGELVKIGRQAVPALLDQIKLYADPTASNCNKAGRALHVMRIMKSPDAIPLAKEILLNFTISANGEHDIECSESTKSAAISECKRRVANSRLTAKYALQEEALEYIYVLFVEKKARDVFASLATKHKGKYYGILPWYHQQFHSFYAGGKHRCNAHLNKNFELLMLNVVKGIPLMIKQRDSRAEDVAIYLLQQLPYKPHPTSCFVDLSTGWKPARVYASDEAYGRQILDSKNRCRMVAMRYLRELRSRKAIPNLEKLLQSPHPDERDFALATLEDITSGGIDMGETNAAVVPEEDKFDVIIMRNGNKISGQIQNASLNLTTSYATMKFSMSKIGHIEMEGADNQLDKMELRNGDKLSGNLDDKEFSVKLQSGGIMTVKKKDISSITFRRVWTTASSKSQR